MNKYQDINNRQYTIHQIIKRQANLLNKVKKLSDQNKVVELLYKEIDRCCMQLDYLNRDRKGWYEKPYVPKNK